MGNYRGIAFGKVEAALTLNPEGLEGDGRGKIIYAGRPTNEKTLMVYRSCKRPAYLSRMNRLRQ